MTETARERERERIIIPVDLSIQNPKLLTIANCITAREDRGISKIPSIGNGVVMRITKEFTK